VNFQVKLGLGVAAVTALAAASLWLLSSSDEEAVEALLREGAAAAERGDADAVVALLSADYRNGEEDRAAAEEKIRRAVGRRTGSLEVAGAAIQVSGDLAEASCRVNVKALQHSLGSFALRVKLRRENGAWKVVAAEERH
jgi:ketosteroid isomerase-like protein